MPAGGEDWRPLYTQSYERIEGKRYAEAVTLLEKLMAGMPDWPGMSPLEAAEILSRLGTAYQKIGRRSDSLTVLQGAVELAPDNAGYHFQLGTRLREDRQYSRAFRVLQRAIELEPDLPGVFRELGRVYAALDQKSDALRALDRHLENDPDDKDTQEAAQALRSSVIGELFSRVSERGWEPYEEEEEESESAGTAKAAAPSDRTNTGQTMDEQTQAIPPGGTPTGNGTAGPTMMSGATVVVDPNRTQQAPPPMMGGPSPGQPQQQTLALTVRIGNRFADSAQRTRQHVLTQVTASGVGGAAFAAGMPGAQQRRLPVNVALVIDRSGSMEGEPLEYVKRACSHVVDLLTPDDVLSIVTFEETVEVLMPARRVAQPDLIKQHIQRIVPGNTTNLFDGLYAGGAQAATVPLQGYVTRVLLLTDGEPTAGLKDFPSIVNQVAELKSRGITVTALGFGPEYNEELMAGIARRSGGNYYYIARPEQIPEVFRQEMETILGVTAKNPRLTLHLPRGCVVRQVYGSPPTFGPRTAEISLPDLERGATITKIWEMDWEPRPAGTYRVAKAVLTWDDGATGRTETASANAVVEFTTDATLIPQGIDAVVAQEIAAAQASRDLEKTMMGMRTQQISAADVTMALERTQALLTQQGKVSEAQELAQATQALRMGDGSGAEKTLIGTIYHLDQGKRR